MPHDHPPAIEIPDGLSDEDAATIVTFLHDLAERFESHYAAQLHRYYHATDQRQASLWGESDPPF